MKERKMEEGNLGITVDIMGITVIKGIAKLLCIKVLEEIRINNLELQNIIKRKNKEKRKKKKNQKITIYKK